MRINLLELINITYWIIIILIILSVIVTSNIIYKTENVLFGDYVTKIVFCRNI